MSANFSVQFRINEKTQTRVIRLTDTSSGFTLAKGNFSVTFPDGSTRIKTEWTSPDITSPAAYIDILAVTDTSDNVITGAYKIDFIALDAATTSYSASKTFDFNWVKPKNSITDLSDVLIPQVQFKDNASYSPIGSFTGTPTRVFSTPFPTTSEASAQPATTTSTNTLTPVYTGNYYEGVYNVSNDITCNYTHTSNSWLTINYIELFTKTVSIKKCPTQVELIDKINDYRAVIEAYKEKNDTQFNLLSEQYDLAIALYSHIIARYETGTQDGSEGQLRELLSILEPYTGSYTYQSTKMLQFELASSGANSFNITDGTNTDSVALGSSLLFSSGNAALVPSISNNQVSYTPIFGSSANTFAQGNDTRFHNAVSIGTANGLSLASQVLSLALATTSTSGAFSASDKAKLDGIAAGANTGTVTSVAVSVPSAFSVSGSPITTNGTINISATGNPLQYITGAGALATLNTGAVPENGSLYFTNARARAAISVTGSLSYNSTTGVISYTTPSETDPIFVASAAYGINSTNISNWNTAYGWGNHASAGYLTSINSSQVTTALGYTPENAANKGVANGYASLDGAGLVPSTQLPSYVDDVLEYADLASLPTTGTTGKIYVTLDTNKIYRWSGTVYVEISSSAGGGGTWGSIAGTLSNQTDLQAALDAKQDDLNGTGFVKASGTTITYDNSTYLTTSAAATAYVPYTGATGNVNLGSNAIIAGKYLIGDSGSANFTRFPNALAVISNIASGVQHNESLYVGLMSEGTSVGNTWGSGVYGAGYTNSTGTGRGTGVTGEGHVSSATDTGVAVGVRGYATDAHSGNYNIGLYGDAENGTFSTYGGNVALFLANGNIVTSSAAAKTWYLGGDITFDGQGSAKVIGVTNGASFALGTVTSGTWNATAIADAYIASASTWNAKVGGSGTANYIPKFTGATTLGNSNIQDSGSFITLGSSTTVSSGSLSIGSSAPAGMNMYILKNLTGALSTFGLSNRGVIQSDSTSGTYYQSVSSTQAAAFTLTTLTHYIATQSTIGAGSTVSNQVAFDVDSSLVGATNNFAFRGRIPNATGRWNLYMSGTAPNYIEGALGIGTSSLTGINLSVGKTLTGSTTAIAVRVSGAIQSDATNIVAYVSTASSTQATAFTVSSLRHYNSSQGSFGAGSTVNNQFAFFADSSLTGATNNYGFYGNLTSATGRWNLYMNGSAQNYLSGDVGIGVTVNHSSAKLQVDSTTEGFLPPRMTSAQRNAIASPAEGLVVVQTDGTKGLYLYIDAAWHALAML